MQIQDHVMFLSMIADAFLCVVLFRYYRRLNRAGLLVQVHATVFMWLFLVMCQVAILQLIFGSVGNQTVEWYVLLGAGFNGPLWHGLAVGWAKNRSEVGSEIRS